MPLVSGVATVLQVLNHSSQEVYGKVWPSATQVVKNYRPREFVTAPLSIYTQVKSIRSCAQVSHRQFTVKMLCSKVFELKFLRLIKKTMGSSQGKVTEVAKAAEQRLSYNMDTVCEWKESPGRGFGLFATAP